MKTTPERNGFTLVELLIAATASAVVILLLATILILGFRCLRTNNAYISLRRDAALAMTWMELDIQEAQQPSSRPPDVPNGLTISNSIEHYIASFELTPSTGVISYHRDGSPMIPILAKNVAAFEPTWHINSFGNVEGVNLHLEMANPEFSIAITNNLFVHMRN